MRRVTAIHHGEGLHRSGNPLMRIHYGFIDRFEGFREKYRNILAWCLAQPLATIGFFVGLMLVSMALFPQLGRDFFPQSDAGQMRLHVRAPPGTRIEQTQAYFAQVEQAIREIAGADQIDTMLDNIGLPYSGMNIALSDSATIGPMDGEVLVSLKEKHTPTADIVARLRRELPARFAQLQFFFQPADIVDQVLNFGQPAPIDIRVSGPDTKETYKLATQLAHDIKTIGGVADSHVFQVPDGPTVNLDVDRALAAELGLDQRSTASNVLVTANGSAQTAPNFWVDPRNGVSYPVVVQMPTYQLKNTGDLRTLPLAAANGAPSQLLMNVAKFSRGTVPVVMSQLNIRPVFDVHADVQGRDLDSVAGAIQKVIDKDKPDAAKAIKVTLSGQVDTMIESYNGLFGGMALAVILVYLCLVINFQSWLDPAIVLMAVPFALGGVMWMLFLSGTHLSVPALMGTLMCIGLTTANSILVVTFANQRLAEGDDPLAAAAAAGYTRIRPVLMTAGAMILGMIPMALGVGEGAEQNAPLGRAVMGGLLFATVSTLLFVPVVFAGVHQRLARRKAARAGDHRARAEPLALPLQET
jgi:multidrug efflux pump subunit AcrB